MLQQLHLNDRKAIASQLAITVEQFDELVQSANHAYDFMKIMGPFYGSEEIQEPTFRTTAEPVRLPIGSKRILSQLGEDLSHMGRALCKLPHIYKNMLGSGLDYRVPLTFRVDCIIDDHGAIHVNEVEGKDGASALMMAEQLAFGLQPFGETTIGRLIKALNKIYLITPEKPLHIAFIRTDTKNDHYVLNTKRFIEMIHELSQGTIQCEIFDTIDLEAGNIPDWSKFAAIFNETNMSPKEIKAFNVPMENVLAAGNYDALVNKGVFALVHEPAIVKFWEKEIGLDRLDRLQSLLIPSRFITTDEELEQARKEGKVVKVTWAEGNMMIANRSQGVAMPAGNVKQSTDERWELLRECLKKGYTLIAQEYVEPGKISAYLRKRGTSIEPVSWYNRLCVKYVHSGNPNGEEAPKIHLTASEITLGPDVVPAGRACAFTAAIPS